MLGPGALSPATAGDDAELKEFSSAYVVEFGDSYQVSCLTLSCFSGLLFQLNFI